MKLVVQVPCLDEEETLPLVLSSIPDSIPGIDEIVVVIIDDGSSDRTVEVARSFGVTEIVRHHRTQGLARSFTDGVNHALAIGADIVVNTDGDHQYPQERIADLVQPILRGEADIVVADRQVGLIDHFSPAKKALQRFGSKVVNVAARTELPDAASGFRAYSREALMRLNTVTRFSYCMETIIQAGNKNLAITSLPVITNAKTRESRLFSSTRQHVFRSGAAIVRAYVMYRPYVIFGAMAVLFGLLGIAPYVRYAVLAAAGQGGGHVQSLLVGAALVVVSSLCAMLGIVSDLIRTNRALIETNLEHTKRARYDILRVPATPSIERPVPAVRHRHGQAGIR
ncbi:glycosyltransferase family 2 protein [Nocardioides hwasunensis]|uniref:Glycosyltransferase family 2 protein n=1 Tax=Nocardioides hwasunensis TaxID=397258 RepID=A0ABR8MD19_9ACTN|nr:glycosyltransferase family 2 protein [Nocardioides hwasunensis]MBD3913126.1 glycosyltransferase family 2 protein [Nocardioides hwasunensis]